MTQKRILITSALPYINGIKHLGNLAGSMLPADVYARYQRARGRETLFICATDEHGTPAELAALEEKLPVAEYCTKWWAVQKQLTEGFALSFDYFGRSSSPQNRELTQHFAKVLWEHGDASVRIVYRQMLANQPDGKDLAYNTVQTLLRLMEDKGLKQSQGVYIAGLTDGGAAQSAGLRDGDIILKIGEQYHSLDDFFNGKCFADAIIDFKSNFLCSIVFPG